MEARQFEPDVLLLQEAPGEQEVERLARGFYGDEASVLCNGDNCVVARGRCRLGPIGANRVYPFAWAEVQLASGMQVQAISVHLLPPQLRDDLWRPDAWRSTADLERGRRQQLQELANMIEATPAGTPIILGGDFNLPAHDGILRLLKPRLHESFRQRGIAWGNTVLNELPISRFDQIWLSGGLRSAGTLAVRSRHSDHRMVVCDVAAR